MNGLGRLGELYGLSPATLSGLADIAGVQSPLYPKNDLDPDYPGAGPQNVPPTYANSTPEPAPAAPAPAAPAQPYVVRNGQVIPVEAPPAAAPTQGDTWQDRYARSTYVSPYKIAEQQAAKEQGGDDAKAVAPANDNAPAAAAPGVAVASTPAVAAAPAVTIPAHMQPFSQSVSTQRPLDPESALEGRFYRQDAAGQRILAADKEAEAAAHRGVADAAYAYGQTMASQHFGAELEKNRQDREAFVKSEHAKLEQLAAAAQKQVDPDYWKAHGGKFPEVLAAISIALGAFGSAMTKTPNAAWEMLKAKMDANIDAQKTNIANAREAYGVRSNLYLRNLEAFGDKDRAILATKAQFLEQLGGMVKQQYAAAQGTANDATYRALMAKIADERADAAYEFNARSGVIAQQSTDRYVPAQTIGGAGAGVVARDENIVTLPDGTNIVVPQDVHEESVKKIQALGETVSLVNELKKDRGQMKTLLEHPWDNYEQIAALRKGIEDKTEKLVYAESKAYEQGVVREAEYPRAAANAGGTAGLGIVGSGSINPAHAWAKGVDSMLDKKQQYLYDKLNREIKATGGQVVDTGYATDPRTGGLRPVMRYTGQDVRAMQPLAPHGSKPMDPSRLGVPQQDAQTVREATPKAPNFGTVPLAPAATREPHGKRKK